METSRLDKFIAEALALTRSQARTLISKGQVTVDGAVCKKADAKVTAETQITAAGKALTAAQPYVYIMLNKPRGVVSASRDDRDETVVDLVAGSYPRRQLFPAGRLDKTSTGFVLLTDDGAFAHDILHPKRHVPKDYIVTLDTPLTQEMVQGFAAGVTLADGQALAPAGVRPVSADGLTVHVQLCQGVYHQIKRMFGVYGAGVNGLHRCAIGGVALDETLAPGAHRPLTEAELARIRAAALPGQAI